MRLNTWVASLGLTLLVQSPLTHAQAGPLDSDPILGQKVVNAKPGELRVMATAAILTPLQAVREQAQKAVGRPIVIEYGSARGNLKKQILAGQDFEVAILLPDVDNEILQAGKIQPKRHEIARVPVAIGLRGDAPPNLDVSTPAALKTALLNAASVKYAPTGAAHDTVDKVLSTLQIADQIKDASKGNPNTAMQLKPGEYELGIFPLSEIIPNKSMKNLGLVPKELQVPAVIEAVVGKNANDQKAAEALIKFLQGPTINPALKESGMEKGQ